MIGLNCCLHFNGPDQSQLQVKSGNACCDDQVEVPMSIDKFFMFDLSQKRAPTNAGKIERIRPNDLIDFIPN